MSTNIKVVRDTYSPTSTTGIVYLQFEGDPEWKPFGFSCEDTDRHVEDDPTRKVKGKTAIPTGVYKLSWYASPKHGGQEVPLLHDVPGFNMVEIHTGNTEADTEGCLLFGLRRTQTSVSESRKAIAWLYDHLRSHGLGTIEVTRE